MEYLKPEEAEADDRHPEDKEPADSPETAHAQTRGAGGVQEAIAATEEMAEICLEEHPHFKIPTMDERGTPVGIDIRKVVETGITPLINTGIAGKIPGTGQIGAGIARAPLACFEQALEAFGAR